MKIRRGATRCVVLVGGCAIKFPRLREWRLFLHGLLANMQERTFWRAYRHPRLCPVLFSSRWGFWLVMRRAEEVRTDTSWEELYSLWLPDGEFSQFVDGEDFRIPMENKSSSFGRLDGRLVAIDYGD